MICANKYHDFQLESSMEILKSITGAKMQGQLPKL